MKRLSVMKIIFVLQISILQFSCDRTVVFDVDTKENRIVVNSLFGADTDIRAILSLSADPLSPAQHNGYISDGLIKIYRNGEYLGNFTNIDSLYTFDQSLFAISENDLFRIEVSAPGRENVTAETMIPASIDNYSVELTDTTYEEINFSTIDSLGNIVFYDTILPYAKFEIQFDDNAGTDYYSLEVIYEDFYNTSSTCFSTSDPVFIDFGFETDNEETLCYEVIFSDLTFEGTTKKIQLSILLPDTEFTSDPKFIFRLRHLSEDYYKYYNSSNLQGGSGDDPFSEPVVVYSNIDNGFGIFAAYAVNEVEIDL